MSSPSASHSVDEYVALRQEISLKVRARLIEALALELQPDEIGLDAPLFGSGLGLDSVDALGIAAAVEEDFDVEVLDTDINLFRSTNAIVDFILVKQGLVERASVYGDRAALTAVTTPADGAASGTDVAVLPTADAEFDMPEDMVPTGLAEALAASPAYLDLDPDHPYARIRKHAAVVDFGAVEKVRVSGPDAAGFLDELAAGNLEELAVGDMLQTVLLRDDGMIRAVVWLMRAESHFWVLGDESASQNIYGWIVEHRGDSEVEVHDATSSHGLVGLIGPKAQDAAVDLFDTDLLRLSYCEFVEKEWNEQTVLVCRYGDTGEYDFRILYESQPEGAEAIADAAAAIGEDLSLPWFDADVTRMLALEMKSIRSEFLPEGDCLPTQVDLHWMIDFSKEGFRGREGAVEAKSRTLPRAILLCADGAEEIPPGSAVQLDGRSVGTVRASTFSYRLASTIALSYVEHDLAWPGVTFEIDLPGGARAARARSAPLFITQTVTDSMNT